MNKLDGRRKAPTPVLPCGAGRAPRLLLALALVLGTAFALAVATRALRIERRSELLIGSREGKGIAVVALPDGRFVHSYVHSIHLSRVDEYFRIEGSKLRLYELRYDTSSVGMPSGAEGGYRLEDGRFVLSMDRSFEMVLVAVSHVPGHGIFVGGSFLPFSDWVPVEESLVLSARTRPIIRFFITRGR